MLKEEEEEEEDLNYDYGVALGHGYQGDFSNYSREWHRNNEFK
jgi:hypothetical protein